MSAETLAERAIACRGWRWLPGMARRDGVRWMGGGGSSPPVHCHKPEDALPDLEDACTLGGLLALVREAWGDRGVYVACLDHDADGYDLGWHTDSDGPGVRSMTGSHASEAAALVAALEAAPDRGVTRAL